MKWKRFFREKFVVSPDRIDLLAGDFTKRIRNFLKIYYKERLIGFSKYFGLVFISYSLTNKILINYGHESFYFLKLIS